MTLREICDLIYDEVQHGWSNEAVLAVEQLENRVDFLEGLIEDGLDLENNFCMKFIWDGGSDDN